MFPNSRLLVLSVRPRLGLASLCCGCRDPNSVPLSHRRLKSVDLVQGGDEPRDLMDAILVDFEGRRAFRLGSWSELVEILKGLITKGESCFMVVAALPIRPLHDDTRYLNKAVILYLCLLAYFWSVTCRNRISDGTEVRDEVFAHYRKTATEMSKARFGPLNCRCLPKVIIMARNVFGAKMRCRPSRR